jgi:NADH-quinone oxidoreductase subunit G
MGKSMIINGKRVEFDKEKNILEVIRKAGFDLPTFCYHSELSIYGACRMCLVEEEKKGIMATCSTPPRDGYVIKTNTEKLRRQRKMTLELLLANHDRECTTCEKNGDCRLRELAYSMGIKEVRFGKRDRRLPIDNSSDAIIRDPNKCILCGDCVRMCEEVQGIGVIGFAYRGSKAVVTPAFNKNLKEVDCVECGQCAAVCPTGALVVKSEIDTVWKALNDPAKRVIAQVAPAVRVAFGEAFGLKPGDRATGKLVAAMKYLGFSEVYDTCFAADLTAVEESREFIKRLENGENLPQFTSCCPAWVRYVELNFPGYINNLSSCRSPQQMFGALAKSYYAENKGVSPEDLFVVSIMPCTAKKTEARRPEFATDGVRHVDAVLSTQEVIRMVKEAGIVFEDLEEEPFDMPFGFATGSGFIFGTTGGVSEAVIRAIDPLNNRKVEDLRGLADFKETAVKLGNREIRIAVVHGLKNAKDLLEKLSRKEVQYDLIEVMACRGGCIGGAGQPYPNDTDSREARSRGLYREDKYIQLINPMENPAVKNLYEKWLGHPSGTKAHKLLHTEYHPKKRIHGEEIHFEGAVGSVTDIKVCIGTCCYLKGSYDIFQKFTEGIKNREIEDKVNLTATFCLENCTGSPSIMVNGKIKNKVTQKDVEEILNSISRGD